MIQIPLFALPLCVLLRLNYGDSLAAILVGSMIYAVSETMLIPFLLRTTGIPLEAVLDSITLRMLFFIPQALVMLLLVLVVHFKKIKIFDLSAYRLTRGK